MKASGLWVSLVAVGTTLLFVSFTGSVTGFYVPELHFSYHGEGTTTKAISRKLKENDYNPSTLEIMKDAHTVTLEDYHPIDPVPSSKASIKPGPIEHGSPIIPFIPKPSPPGHP
ncbi:uncharacterized protein LOC107433730 [Ziziphus jujuba]|uniref:Uncharacterized protein LOC107433730 n=1 Tax=Ziziphus jujuba TaxID=326968 RepID=A0A6P3ZX92_ZIZJJ|nr:uncharacterized protein LOC107433730 [Ziziphus jujuba]